MERKQIRKAVIKDGVVLPELVAKNKGPRYRPYGKDDLQARIKPLHIDLAAQCDIKAINREFRKRTGKDVFAYVFDW